MSRNSRVASVAGVCGTALLAAVPCYAQTPVTAFAHVAVIPMDRERVLRDQTVLVRGGRIVALGPAAQVRVPAGAVRVDGRGKFLIPGLADMHAHVPGATMTFAPFGNGGPGFNSQEERQAWLKAYAMPLDSGKGDADPTLGSGAAEIKRLLFLYVANGVTTIRVMQGWPGHLRLREQAAKGELLSPRLYVAANSLRNRGDMSGAAPEAEVRYVEGVKAAGFDLLKMYEGWKTSVRDSAVAVARRVGLPIAGHLPTTSTDDALAALEYAIATGQRSIEHLILEPGLQYATGAKNVGTEDGLRDTARAEPKLRELGGRLRQAGVWLCPTAAHEILWRRRDWSALRYLVPGRVADMNIDTVSPLSDVNQAQYALLGHTLRALHAGGAKLLLGTDAFFGQLPGFTVHDELAAFVYMGFTPYQALETGTRNVAEYWGTLDSTGTIAVGKRADLVLLSGNPLADIKHTRRPAGVMVRGQWLARAELDQILTLLEGILWG